jgi:hypothetical protein
MICNDLAQFQTLFFVLCRLDILTALKIVV